jgi:hypothetical protein
MADLVLQEPAVVIARDAQDMRLPQQVAAAIQVASAIGDVTRADNRVYADSVEILQHKLQPLVLCV